MYEGLLPAAHADDEVSSARARLLMSSDTNSPTASRPVQRRERGAGIEAIGRLSCIRRRCGTATTRLDAGHLCNCLPALHLPRVVASSCGVDETGSTLLGQLRLDGRLGEHLVHRIDQGARTAGARRQGRRWFATTSRRPWESRARSRWEARARRRSPAEVIARARTLPSWTKG